MLGIGLFSLGSRHQLMIENSALYCSDKYCRAIFSIPIASIAISVTPQRESPTKKSAKASGIKNLYIRFHLFMAHPPICKTCCPHYSIRKSGFPLVLSSNAQRGRGRIAPPASPRKPVTPAPRSRLRRPPALSGRFWRWAGCYPSPPLPRPVRGLWRRSGRSIRPVCGGCVR